MHRVSLLLRTTDTMFYLVPHTKYLVSHMTFAVFSHLFPLASAVVFSVKVQVFFIFETFKMLPDRIRTEYW